MKVSKAIRLCLLLMVFCTLFIKPRKAEANFTVNVSENGATITSTDIKKDQLTEGKKGFVTVGFTVSVGTPTATHGGGPSIYVDNNYTGLYFNTTTHGNDFTDWSDVAAGTTYTTTYKLSPVQINGTLAQSGYTFEQFLNGECTLVFDAIVVSTTNRRIQSPPYTVYSIMDDNTWALKRPDPAELGTAHYRYRNQNKYHNGIAPLVSWDDEEDHFEIVVSNKKIDETIGKEEPPVSKSYPIRFGSSFTEKSWKTISGANPLAMNAKPDLISTYNFDKDNYYHIGNIPSEDISKDGIPSSGNTIKTYIHNGVVASSWAGSCGAILTATNSDFYYDIPCEFNYKLREKIGEKKVGPPGGEHMEDVYGEVSYHYSGEASFEIHMYYDYYEVGDLAFYDIKKAEVRMQSIDDTEQLYPSMMPEYKSSVLYFSFDKSKRIVTNNYKKLTPEEIFKRYATNTPTYRGKYKKDFTGLQPKKPDSSEVNKDARNFFYDTYVKDYLTEQYFYTKDATINIDDVDHLETTIHSLNTAPSTLTENIDAGKVDAKLKTPGFINSFPLGRVEKGVVEPLKIKASNEASNNVIREDAKNGVYYNELTVWYENAGVEVPFNVKDTKGKVDAILQNMYKSTLEELGAIKKDPLLDEKTFRTPPLVCPQSPGKTYTYVEDEPIIIHTPVIANVNITNPENNTQLINESTDNGSIADEYDSIEAYVNDNELRLDEWYKVRFNDEEHKDSPGYFGADDRILDDEFVLKKTFIFPFDVVYKDKVIKAGAETDIDKSDYKEFSFYIPSWSDTGIYGVAGFKDHIIFKVYAKNSSRGNTEEIKHNIHSPEEESTYVATYYIPCQVSGWIYDFKAIGINDAYLYDIDYKNPNIAPNKAVSLCPIYREKRVGQFNRKGTDYVRFEKDGRVTDNWSKVNTLPFSRGKSNNYPGMGNLRRGNYFTFSLKTIDNLTKEEDSVEIDVSYRALNKDKSSMGTYGKDYRIYYIDETSSGLDLIEYGSSKDTYKTTSLAEKTHTCAKSNYIFTKKLGDNETSTEKLTFRYRNEEGAKFVTVNEMINVVEDCYKLDKIHLSSNLKLFTGNKGQLFEYFDKDFSENYMPNTSYAYRFLNPKYLNFSYADTFNKSMQTWYGKYYIPEDLVVIDLNKLKSMGYSSIDDYVMDNDGLLFTEDFFVDEGYLVLNFDIKTSDDDEPYNNLGYSANNGGQSVWKNERDGNPNPDPPGDETPTPDAPTDPDDDLPPKEEGDEEDIDPFIDGDVGVIPLDPITNIRYRYYVGLWGIN